MSSPIDPKYVPIICRTYFEQLDSKVFRLHTHEDEPRFTMYALSVELVSLETMLNVDGAAVPGSYFLAHCYLSGAPDGEPLRFIR